MSIKKNLIVVDPFDNLGIRVNNILNYYKIFILNHKPIFYISEKITIKLIRNYLAMFLYHKINPFKFKYVLSLNKFTESDILLDLNGVHKKVNELDLSNFKGKSFFHLLDFFFNPLETNNFLLKNNITYLLGYNYHDKYSDFFMKYYPTFKNKVVSIPFGYHKRFQPLNTFYKRQKKAVILGSLNPINDPRCKKEEIKSYMEFFGKNNFMHPIRYKLAFDRENLLYQKVIDIRLPVYPQTKDFSYDAVEMMNRYQMFINDESVLNFPPARTYEGIAAGCVMVCTDNSIYKDLGFINKKNCIMFKKGDYEDLVKKIKYYQKNQKELAKIQKNSLKLAENFTHEKIADLLYEEIMKRA